MLPGPVGGILSNLSIADGSVYVATTLDVPVIATSLNTADGNKGGGPQTGEVAALSLATGKVEWDVKVPSLPLGAATVSHDLVFTTLETGELLPLNRTPARSSTGAGRRHRRTRRYPSSGTRCWSRRAAQVSGVGRRREPAAGGLYGAVTIAAPASLVG